MTAAAGGRDGFPATRGYVWQDRDQGRLHGRVAGIALGATGRFGFALAGRAALAVHGLASLPHKGYGRAPRPVEGVELATDQDPGVRQAAGLVVQALRREGFTARENTTLADLSARHPWLRDCLARWVVTGPGEGRVSLELAFAARFKEPVRIDGAGLVVHVEDAAGTLILALTAGKGRPGEYADAAWLLDRYDPAALIGFARRLDFSLSSAEAAAIGQRLDALPAQAFSGLGLTGQQVTALRARFASWPREASAVPGEGDAR